MPEVEVKLTALSNISYNPTKMLEWSQEDWDEMTPDEREALIREEAEAFIAEQIEWDYKVL